MIAGSWRGYSTRSQAAQRAASRSGGRSYSGSGSYSSGSYGNGRLTPSQVAEMQRSLGVTPDGVWGSESSAAADGMTADEAWSAYQKDKTGGDWKNTRAGSVISSVMGR